MKSYRQKYQYTAVGIGLIIRTHREKMGMTQDELATKCGFGRSNLAIIERGKSDLSFRSLMALADALECDVSELTRNHKTWKTVEVALDKEKIETEDERKCLVKVVLTILNSEENGNGQSTKSLANSC